MAKKRRAKRAPAKKISRAMHMRKKGKHMAYCCAVCGKEANKKTKHHGRMMEKC